MQQYTLSSSQPQLPALSEGEVRSPPQWGASGYEAEWAVGPLAAGLPGPQEFSLAACQQEV